MLFQSETREWALIWEQLFGRPLKTAILRGNYFKMTSEQDSVLTG